MRIALLRLSLLVLITSSCVCQQIGSIDFPQIGQVKIKATLPKGSYPTLRLSVPAKTLLAVEIRGGDDDFDFWRVSKSAHPGLTENPRLYFEIVHGPVLDSPWIIPIAQYPGGSDCEYQATVIGQEKRKLGLLLPNQVLVHAEGGFYAGDLGDGTGFGFAAWDFIWKDEGHADPHLYSIRRYAYDSKLQRLIAMPVLQSSKRYATPEEALAEFGLHYPNLLLSRPVYGC